MSDEAPEKPDPTEPLVFMAAPEPLDFGPLSLVACDDVTITHSEEQHLDPFWVGNWIIRTN